MRIDAETDLFDNMNRETPKLDGKRLFSDLVNKSDAHDLYDFQTDLSFQKKLLEARNVTDYNNKHGMSDEYNLPTKKVHPKKYSFIHN